MTYLRRKKHISRAFSLNGPYLNKKFGKQFFWTHQKNWAVNVLKYSFLPVLQQKGFIITNYAPFSLAEMVKNIEN